MEDEEIERVRPSYFMIITLQAYDKRPIEKAYCYLAEDSSGRKALGWSMQEALANLGIAFHQEVLKK